MWNTIAPNVGLDNLRKQPNMTYEKIRNALWFVIGVLCCALFVSVYFFLSSNMKHPTESYSATLWIKKPDGFLEQRTEIVQANGKNAHNYVERQIYKKYGRVAIVNIIYQ